MNKSDEKMYLHTYSVKIYAFIYNKNKIKYSKKLSDVFNYYEIDR